MKFKFKGRDGMKDFNLAIAGITGMEETLTRGQIVDVPDGHELIPRLKENGLWEEIGEKPEEKPEEKPKPPKKTKKVKNGGE